MCIHTIKRQLYNHKQRVIVDRFLGAAHKPEIPVLQNFCTNMNPGPYQCISAQHHLGY